MFTLSADSSTTTDRVNVTWNDTNQARCTWMTLEGLYLRHRVPHAQPYRKTPLEIIMATAHGVCNLANAKPILCLALRDIIICRIRCGQPFTIVKTS